MNKLIILKLFCEYFMNITFDEYLIKKKINSEKFRREDAETYLRFAFAFQQMHEESFTMQKLYWINKLRRLYK